MTKEELKKFQRVLENIDREREAAYIKKNFMEEHDFEVEARFYLYKIQAYDFCISELSYVIRNIKVE